MSRLITAVIFAIAGALVALATKNAYAGSATAVLLAAIDCIVQDGIRKSKGL